MALKIKNFFKSLIGTKAFYKKVIIIAVPVMLQQGITSFVSLLDNLMVGSYNSLAMTGVGVANQIYFILQVVLVGGLAAAGIFLAQYFGAKDEEGIKNSFRFKLQYGLIVLIVALLLLTFYSDVFIKAFLTSPASIEDGKQIYDYAQKYLYLMMIGIVPFIISQIYATTLREVGSPKLPLYAGIIAFFVNFVINFLLINGHFGFPRLGIVGAAIGTITSRYVECLFLLLATHLNHKKFPFMKKIYSTIRVPVYLSNRIVIKGTPLILNEFLWSFGMTKLLVYYSERGTEVLKDFNISNTVTNLFFIVFSALATAISIIIGQALGAGRLEEARDNVKKLLAFAIFACIISGIILAIISPFIPYLYKDITSEVRHMATAFMLIIAVCIPIFGFNSGCFFTLRAGGVTVVTFLFDAFYVWVVNIPLAIILIRFTDLSIIPLYFIVQASDLIKSIIGFSIVKTGVWVKNITTVKQ